VLWFTVWLVLVAGTVAGAFWLLRRLYRSATRLVAELEQLTGALDAVAEGGTAVPTVTTPAPVDLQDPGPARARLELARAVRAERRLRRAERHVETYRRWQALTR